MGTAQWWARIVGWLSGVAVPPAAEAAGQGPVDVLGLAVDAVMADAARRNTGRLLILPDTVTVSLPGEDYEYWSGLQTVLRTQIEEGIEARAKRAAMRLGGRKEIDGGAIRLILLQSQDAAVHITVRRVGNVSDHRDHVEHTRRVDEPAVIQAAAPRELKLDVAGRNAGICHAVSGAQAGRSTDCELIIPATEVYASHIATTVLAAHKDGVNLRVDNRNGAWLRDETGHTSTVRPGRAILLRPGQHLYLDPDARIALHLN